MTGSRIDLSAIRYDCPYRESFVLCDSLLSVTANMGTLVLMNASCFHLSCSWVSRAIALCHPGESAGRKPNAFIALRSADCSIRRDRANNTQKVYPFSFSDINWRQCWGGIDDGTCTKNCKLDTVTEFLGQLDPHFQPSPGRRSRVCENRRKNNNKLRGRV